MITACVLAALITQGSLLQRVVPRETGQNGYEEYVRAAIFLDRPDNKDLEKYVLARVSTDNVAARPAGVPDNATLLDLYRLDVKALAPALDLVRTGNEKPVSYPNQPVTAITLMPELTKFKTIARLFARLAYVSYASGNSRAGARAILDGLTFSRKIQCLGTLHLVTGRWCEQVIYGAIERHQDQISISDADGIQKWLESLPDNRVLFASAAAVDRACYRATYDEFGSRPEEYLRVAGANREKLEVEAGRAKSMAPVRRDKVYAFIERYFEALWVELSDRLKKPESEWLQPLSGGTPSDAAMKQDLTEDTAGAALLLVSVFSEPTDGIRDFPATLARYQIQERLVGVYAAVIRYRWVNNALPASLAEVFGKEPIDPTSGQPYTYEIVDKSFRVTCKAPGLGDVGLVYQGAKSDPGEIHPN